VARLSESGIYFAGDSLQRDDGCIPHSRVLGRVRLLKRRPLTLRLPLCSDLQRLWRVVERRLLRVRA